MKRGKQYEAVEKAVINYVTGTGYFCDVADAAEIGEDTLANSNILYNYDSWFMNLRGNDDGLSETQVKEDKKMCEACVLGILGLKYIDTNYVYVVREYKKDGGIMSPCNVFASAYDIVSYYGHGADITDEFGKITDIDELLKYIAYGSNSTIIKVTPDPVENDYIDIEPSQPVYYHIAKKEIIKKK